MKKNPASRRGTTRKLFNTRSHKLLKTSLLSSTLVALALSGHAQFTLYQTDRDHIYPSVHTISPADPSPWKMGGYAIATTTVDRNTGTTTGELIRTDPGGTQLWTMQYPGNGNNRFTSINKFLSNGPSEYIVTGSVSTGGNDHLLAAHIDDMGNVVDAVELTDLYEPNLIGIKAIPTSDGNIAIVALACTGYDPTDEKYTVVIRLDPHLNILNYHVYDTHKNGNNDYDTPSGIVEGASPEEFLIVGTANRQGSFTDVSSALATLVNINTGNVLWSNNFSTASLWHWDNSADAWFNPNDKTFWILGNSSVNHYYNLSQISNSGTPMLFQQYYAASGLQNDTYGFKLKPSLKTPGNLVVGGWAYPMGAYGCATPFMAEISPAAGAAVWGFNYTNPTGSANINRMAAYVENPWLRATGSGQFPYYYNSLMGYAYDQKGYVVLGSDSTYSPAEKPRLWRSVDLQGTMYCGSTSQGILECPTCISNIEQGLDYVGDFPVNIDYYPLSTEPIKYKEKTCGKGSGEAGWKVAANAPANFRIYPNPATDHVTIESPEGLQSVTLSDVYGRMLIQASPAGIQSMQLTTSDLPNGVYMIRTSDTHNQQRTQTIQVLR